MRRRYGAVVLAIGLLALVGGGAWSLAQTETTPPAANQGITPEILGITQPSNSPGQELALRRVTIAPGGTLAPHTHPGDQLIWLESGTLRLVVVDGEVPIQRAPTNGTPGPNEVISSGGETDLLPGDSWVEPAGVIHYGLNLGSEPGILWAATLYPAGQPAANPVAPAATPAP